MWKFAALAVAAALMAACSKSPQDQHAEALRTAANDQAQQIEQRADAQAKALNDQAAGLKTQAKQAGGYTGQRLKVQGDALAREADIVSRQGHAQAEATREAADAQAKAIKSR